MKYYTGGIACAIAALAFFPSLAVGQSDRYKPIGTHKNGQAEVSIYLDLQSIKQTGANSYQYTTVEDITRQIGTEQDAVVNCKNPKLIYLLETRLYDQGSLVKKDTLEVRQDAVKLQSKANVIVCQTVRPSVKQSSPQISQIQPISSETRPNATIEQAILKRFSLRKQAQYYYNLVDLNGDGQPEAIVLLNALDYCGSNGCSVLVLKKTEEQYTLVSEIRATGKPVIVTNQKTNGWYDLVALDNRDRYLLKFNGKSYPNSLTAGTKLSNNSSFAGQALFIDGFEEPGIVLLP